MPLQQPQATLPTQAPADLDHLNYREASFVRAKSAVLSDSGFRSFDSAASFSGSERFFHIFPVALKTSGSDPATGLIEQDAIPDTRDRQPLMVSG